MGAAFHPLKVRLFGEFGAGLVLDSGSDDVIVWCSYQRQVVVYSSAEESQRWLKTMVKLQARQQTRALLADIFCTSRSHAIVPLWYRGFVNVMPISRIIPLRAFLCNACVVHGVSD